MEENIEAILPEKCECKKLLKHYYKILRKSITPSNSLQNHNTELNTTSHKNYWNLDNPELYTCQPTIIHVSQTIGPNTTFEVPACSSQNIQILQSLDSFVIKTDIKNDNNNSNATPDNDIQTAISSISEKHYRVSVKSF